MAMAPDYTVEVRDRNFARIGQIAQKSLDLKFLEVFRGVGSWEMKLPAEHPLLPDLKAKGSGIIITQRSTGRVFSGRTQSCILSQDAEDPTGTWVISGVDDNVIAAATVVYPVPTAAANAQTAAYWVDGGTGEYVMKRLVSLNAGSAALASRKYPWLSVPTNLGRGSSVTCSLRFDLLGDALTSLAIASNLGWRFYQSGAGVTFDVYEPAVKTDLVRLDIRTGGLESADLGWSAPTATEVLVLGQGEGADRTVLPVSTTASLAEATEWGLRWEAAKDQRNTDDPAELLQAGEEILTEQGSTVRSLNVNPSDAPGQKLGTDWWLGDLVTVIIEGQPTTATVSQVATGISAEGVIRQATVGDPVGFDWEAQVGNRLKTQNTRISALETAVEAGFSVAWTEISGKPTTFTPSAHNHAGTEITSGTINKDRLPATLNATTVPSLVATGNIEVGNVLIGTQGVDGHLLMAAQNDAGTSTSDLQFLNDGTLRTRAGGAGGQYRNFPFAAATGVTASSTSIPASSGTTFNIPLPSGRFTQAPVAVATSESSRLTVSVIGTTTTTLSVRVDNWSGAAGIPVNIRWLAFQMTPTSAIG